ncbi:MAG: ATP-dependent DNA helicase RecG [bacterium]|nr:ATP-dependent DNA helicase RecG [bacterium]
MITLSTPLVDIKGIPPRFLKRLEKLKILTIKDILWHFPSRYEDFSEILPISQLEPGQQTTIQGVVRDIKLKRSFRRRFVIVEARIADDSGEIKAVWFNQPYLLNTLRPGRMANFSGKVSLGEKEIYLSHPAYELIDRGLTQMGTQMDADVGADETQISADTDYNENQRESAYKSALIGETRHTARLVPIYPETRGLTSKGIRFLIQPILKNIGEISEWLPEEILKKTGLPEINQALNDIHFPELEEAALSAKKRFAFEDIFLLQIFNMRQKLKLAKEKAPVIETNLTELKKITEALPFKLTLSQKKSLWEIVQDIGKPAPMNRLLQGDVGSGKTVVAAVAALLAANNGFQSAFMAPTEILARQHFQTLKKIFAGLPLKKQPEIGLLVSKEAKIFYENDLESSVPKDEFKKKIESGSLKVVVGTHALIEKDIKFDSLGLVIVDEQHRFGVRQRAQLVHGRKILPHLLSMSATPIPRTLMLTIFGDLDISIISELPAGRKAIVTKIVAPANRSKAYQFIREQIKKGRQAFVICPRIDPAEEKEVERGKTQKLDLWEVKSVKEEYEKLSKEIFPDLHVGMLHGQLKSKEKENVMANFKSKKIDLLVSTSVIEVGVDIPNASIMLIEGADRFGLAQLYQFRGRVGRGEYQSFCFLFTDSAAKTTADRLKAIVEAKNGFELAEKDLKLRGPGEFIGQKQTGLPDVAMRGLQDFELIKNSREAAVEVLEKDKNLKNNPLLAEKLAEFERKIHLE